MNYLLHGATLSLACFLCVNAVTSAAVATMSRAAWRSESPSLWLAARLLPSLGAALFVAAVFIPAYVLFEPRDTGEGFDATLTACAGLAFALTVVAGYRGLAGWRRVRRHTRDWMAHGAPAVIGGRRVLVADAETPFLALVGVVRPRLLVTRGLIDALTPEELEASLAHEVGHSRAWDNFKRLAMCASPDLLPASAARRLERRWAAAAEHAADGQARGAGMRCALAAALVKVARLTPAAPPTLDPISTLIGGGDITDRVRRLLDDRLPPRGSRASLWLAAAAVAAVCAGTYLPLLHAVHGATEVLVRVLP